MSFLEGFVVGFAMIIFVGPVFFLLLNSSLQFGTKAGIAVALGIILSDLIYVSLCYFGLSKFIDIEQNRFWMGSLGSIILFILGVSYLLKRAAILENNMPEVHSLHALFLKGFSINFFNPFVFGVWIGVYHYGKSKYPDPYLLTIFFASVLLGILTTDLLKVFLSAKLKNFMSTKRLNVLFKFTGIVMVLFSIRLLYMVL